MIHFNIQPIDTSIQATIQHKLDSKTKPLGSLGLLEKIANKVSLIQNILEPKLTNPHLVVFAGDHGIAEEKVSAYPAEVTGQMVLNFVGGGAAINVLCQQNNISMKIVDAGVNFDFPKDCPVLPYKIAKSTKNFAKQAAMTTQECEQAIQQGANIVEEIQQEGANIIGFGEMGIANTSSASVLMHAITQIPLEQCVGKGTGIDTGGLNHKLTVLQKAIEKYNVQNLSTQEILATFGGFEIAMMCGAMLKAAELKMIVLVDGFIASSAYLVAQELYPDIKDYSLFCHQSQENGHKFLLSYLKATPILQMDMRLGEGTGCALAYPIIQSAINIINKMASFDEAGVSSKE